ncbi:hypothetical protein IMZ48_06005 [Candidatus Bathyarchaeota archaeon]|nr:hypothetical protein [Candidatus Bathyarchaeota archaeon]
MVAVFGSLLQLGVLIFCGFATNHPGLNLLKDGKQVVGYAFTCTAAGTLLLVAGMVLCCHVVESSTSETRYRPVAGMQARIVWLQRSGTVSDQAFESFGVFPTEPRNTIITSQRATKRKELFAVIGTAISLGGYIVQFIGLRGMHWSASVAQLGAIALMTVLRAWIRRDLARLPASQPLVSDHELDWLAITLATDHEKSPWLDSSKATRDTRSRPWAEDGWDWSIPGVQDPANCKKLKPRSDITVAGLKAQRVLKTRRDLGKLADWHGPASAEAISLARAIEIVMDTLDPLSEKHTGELSWTLEVCGEPIYFRLEQEAGSWKAFSDELEAALSLWIYSMHAAEHHQDNIYNAHREPQLENENSSSAASVIEIEEDVPTDEDGTIEVETHRVLGFAPDMDRGSLKTFRRFKVSPNTGLADRVGSDDDIDQKGSAVMILATEKYSPIKSLLANHMFSSFMWAAARRLRQPMPGGAEVRPTYSKSGASNSTWQSFRLHNAQLSKLAQDITNTGIGTLEEAYLSIIPPLSTLDSLPHTDSVIRWARKQARAHENVGRWNEAGEVYIWLFKLWKGSKMLSRQAIISIEATTWLVECLEAVTCAMELKTTIAINAMDNGTYKLKELLSKLRKELKGAHGGVLARLEALYLMQHRA